ncbi:MAG: hypothetical protein IKC56_05125 [Clostridia bacterium]|nr:hypothetical protein [Clostridia bacterium]
MRRYRQSLYPVIFRSVQASLCGFTAYVAISSVFYGNLLMVCGGELFAATAFSIALFALVFAIGMIDDLRKDVYTHAESVAFAAFGRVPALSSFIPKERVLRVTYSAGLLKRLLKTRKLVIITESGREVLYVKEKDFSAICTSLPEPFAKAVMRVENKEKYDSGVSFGYSYLEGVRVALRVFASALILLCTIFPGVIGIFFGNGVSLKNTFPNLSLGGALAVIFAIAVGVSLLLALFVGGAKMLNLALPYANYRVDREGNILLVSYGRLMTRVHAFRLDRLRMVRRSYFPLLNLGAQSVKLYFAEGKRTVVLPVAQRGLKKAELQKVMERIPSYAEGELKPLPLTRYLPTVLAFTVLGIVPVVLFATLESWVILCLCIPLILAFCRIAQVRAVGETEKAISFRKGALTVSTLTVLKKNVSCVKIHSGAFARPFRKVTVQFYLKQTETTLEIPCLTREEGEKAVFLAKHTKK